MQWLKRQKFSGVTIHFNPWRGCSRFSEGCRFCYAEKWANRNPAVFGKWGDQGTRIIASDTTWKEPIRWDRAAEKAGERRRVFCASMADVFEDRPELIVPRGRLFRLIASTTNLDWLLLTKRPENVLDMTFDEWCVGLSWQWPLNVWLGVSVENQATADERIPILLNTPAAVRFVSAEPLLEAIDLRLSHEIDLVIVGGESGQQARTCRVEWIRSPVEQCHAAGVACFVKQFGSNVVTRNDQIEDHWEWGSSRISYNIHGFREQNQGADCRIHLKDRKGGDMAEWPEWARVRELPKSRKPT